MIVDALVAVALVLFGLSGAKSGFLRQLTQWVGLACAAFGCGPVAAQLTPPLAVLAPHVPAAAIRIGLDSVFFCLIGGTMAFAVDHVLRRGVQEDGRVDKHGGFLLGIGKGAAIIAGFLSVALFFEGPIERRAPFVTPQVQDSYAIGLVRRCDILKKVSLGTAAKFEKLARIARDPKSMKADIADEPALQVLLSDPAVKSALQNDRFIQALQKGDLAQIQNDPRLAALLKDPRLLGQQQAPQP